MHEFVDEIARPVIAGAPAQLISHETRGKARCAGFGEPADQRGGGRKPCRAVTRQIRHQLARQMLKRQVAGPARQRVVADVNEAARFQVTVDEPAQFRAHRAVDPAVNAMRDNVVEAR